MPSIAMNFEASYISYSETGWFSKMVTDYIDNRDSLKGFYNYPATIDGVKKAIATRKHFSTNRKLLCARLEEKYLAVQVQPAVSKNIASLSNENTFTVCTAHQPNIFTGHLYFIYKILHAIRLCEDLKKEISDCHFVPVYYMGSEDADLEELGEINIHGKKYTWQTDQKGAVGRMKIDKAFLFLIAELHGQLSVEKYGNEILAVVQECYTEGKTIEQATFGFVDALFGSYGLVVILPDDHLLKNEFAPVVIKELNEQFSNKIVADTLASLPGEYKLQAAGREINLFYLKDDSRERIEVSNTGFSVANTKTVFSKEEIFEELKNYPERFSPNVILRPLFQEMILPNVCFIGGGGELAYWLELKNVFEAVSIPYPVLVMRNSFLVINKVIAGKLAGLKLDAADFFQSNDHLMGMFVKRESSLPLALNKEKILLNDLYDKISHVAQAVDLTLQHHTAALKKQAIHRIEKLEKKIVRAEKRKFDAEQRQITKIKTDLFRNNTLQERIDNILPYYSRWGNEIIAILFQFSGGLEQQFCILTETPEQKPSTGPK